MRDFLPAELARRQYITDTIKAVFEKFGFQPIYTPAMENLPTLTGKYGEEGDKLLYKVLNSGDYLQKASSEDLDAKRSNKVTPQISKKGLRYDLTVPLARFVVQHQNDITFPFRRYHIASVWRSDRPQKGRYCEFFQCDADVIGSPSLLNEVELMQIYSEVFEALKLNVTIKYNSRKLLVGLMTAIGLEENLVTAITILDKLDKIGLDKVIEEMTAIGLSESNAEKLRNVLESNDMSSFASSDLIASGKEEVAAIADANIPNTKFDISLARGLDYYTGCIFEVVPNDYEMGSLGGGGRYDNLTEMFGKSDLTGVGISFGLDRIYDVMEGQQKFPESIVAACNILFAHFDAPTRSYAFNCLKSVREAGISAEIYPDLAKFQKQMKYADNKQIPFVCLIGESEMESGKLTLKNMLDGKQESLSLEELIAKFK